MNTPEHLKQIVKEKYTLIAENSDRGSASGCCGASCGCATVDGTLMAEDYKSLPGYVGEADLGLGCGLPTEFARISEGDVVVDLGSGAGNDAFIARSLTGVTGKVIGVDFTEKMISKARANARKLGLNNVEFRQGDIEDTPVSDNTADVVVSNCVLNLVPDKTRAFREIFRILKPGGHFSVSDIVTQGDLPKILLESAELYAGCVSGAIRKDHYLRMVNDAGFTSVTVLKERKIAVEDEILSRYLNTGDADSGTSANPGIFSITVYGEKPAAAEVEESCCDAECCGNVNV